MTDSEAPGDPGTWRRPGVRWLMLVLAVLGLSLWATRCVTEDARQRNHGQEGGAADMSEPADDGASGARVRGQIWLESVIEPAEAGETLAADDAGAQDETDAPVQLLAPDRGSCRITAWQDGRRVADEVTCDDDGQFEVRMHPGVGGRTTFELVIPGRLRAVVETDVPAEGVGRLPAVALGVAQTVAGHVVDGRGTALTGVELQAMPIPNLGESEPWRSTTDEDGAFVFDTLPPGPVAMRADVPGYAPTVVEALSPADDVLLVLDSMMALKGRVVGSPERIAAAVVRLEGSAIWPAREAAVDAAGKFVFEEVPDGTYGIEAVIVSPDRSGPEFASVPLENVTPDLEVTLALTRAYRVPVRVVGPGGEPVVGARVTVGNSQIGLLQRMAQTDAQGRARLGPVVVGPYVIRADADGYLPSEPMLVSVEGDTLTELTLTLTRPGTISGIVVDADGRPVEGAAVQVESDALYTAGEGQARAQVFRTAKVSAGTLGVTAGPVPEIPRFGEPHDDAATVPMSDVNGRFVLEGLHPGSYALQAEHGLYARSAQTQIRIRSGEHRTGVRLVLGAGVHLTGRVVNDNFRPIIGASVELDDGSSVLTDVRGVFDAGFRRGRQNLVARAGGKVPREVTVTLRDTPVDLEIQLPDARGGLEGRALDANGRPLPGVQVTLSMLDGLSPTRLAWTDARGVFELDALSSGRAEIELRHADFLPWTRTLTLEDEHTSLEATLLEGWSVEVFVAEPGTRDPIAGASVIGAEHHAVTDAKGMAILRGLSQSPVHIEVLAEGFTRGAVSVSRPASDVAEAEVELGLGGGMEGEVSDFRGDAIAGALVVVRDKRSRTLLAQVHTTAGGRWTVAGIPEGDVVVEAFPPVELEDEQAAIALDSDVIAGHVTKGVDLRFDRR